MKRKPIHRYLEAINLLTNAHSELLHACDSSSNLWRSTFDYPNCGTNTGQPIGPGPNDSTHEEQFKPRFQPFRACT